MSSIIVNANDHMLTLLMQEWMMGSRKVKLNFRE